MVKDIFVCVNETSGRENVITAAATLANDLNAQLHGLFVRVDSVLTATPYGVLDTQVIQNAQKRESQYATQAKQEFLDITENKGCDATWHEMSESDNPFKVLLYADLIITNQVTYEPRRSHSNFGYINDLIVDSAKPVILIPEQWQGTSFGANILVGWNESKQASRAIANAMPLLQRADKVDVLTVEYQGNHSDNASKVSDYLNRRNVANSFHIVEADEDYDYVEKILLKTAKEHESDLLVVGGYGHSRIRELFLGGTTRYLTRHSEIPVLFSN
jgi:nucleotide-binding universal stress UspA family protein